MTGQTLANVGVKIKAKIRYFMFIFMVLYKNRNGFTPPVQTGGASQSGAYKRHLVPAENAPCRGDMDYRSV